MTNIDPIKVEAEILQEIISQTRAHTQLEIVLGSDNIVRIYSDRVCVLRIRADHGCEVTLIGLEQETTCTILARDRP